MRIFFSHRKRQITQLLCALLYNANVKGFLNGAIYGGGSKAVCVPGLNCYSCPGAVGSCPLGALQMALSDIKYSFPYYILGLLLLFGVLAGRLICGFLCPFGFIQELLYKIPFFKVKRKFKYIKYLKYFFLGVFVIGLPLFYGLTEVVSSPFFCKYFCPAGTLEAGVPLLALNGSLRTLIGYLWGQKLFILVVIVMLSLMIYRPFCKFMCPLGAIYGFFNKVSFYRYSVDKNACTHCGKCAEVCKMDIDPVANCNSCECIRCGDCKSCCEKKAISSGPNRS